MQHCAKIFINLEEIQMRTENMRTLNDSSSNFKWAGDSSEDRATSRTLNDSSSNFKWAGDSSED